MVLAGWKMGHDMSKQVEEIHARQNAKIEKMFAQIP
jgi:hypothetical protein